jgi:UDP-N-acetylglucosamine--N-acetylmuramyl-(pentapeptide) pyrophosphoryl-undecaprenol N-acetylglucosamine transferase
MVRDTAPRRVLLAGGGTAGHTSPLLATADALRRRDPDIEITALGTARGLETRVIPEAGYPLELVPPVPLPRRPNADLLRTPGRLRGAMKAALEVIDRIQPDVVAGFGGYVSVPAYLAARKRHLPLVVHEGNALPGIANKLGARFTSHVATSFPDTDLPHAHYIGLPIRRMISTLDRAALRAEARESFGLDPDLPTLLVTGGSQGARRLNQSVAAAAPAFAAAGVQVLHIVGPTGEATPQATPGGPPYVVVPFVSRMDLAYAAVDAVLCRAGSNTVTEVSGVGLPAIYVPLPIGNGEQALNARPVVDAGGGLLVADAALTPEWVRGTVPDLMTDPSRLAAMSAAASHVIPLDADDKLAEMILTARSRTQERKRPRRGPRR